MLSPEARERRRVRTPVLAVTGVAWLVTSIALGGDVRSPQPGDGSAGMVMSNPSGTSAMNHLPHPSAGSLLGFLGMWLLTVTAMMSPLLIRPLRHLGARTLPRHRFAARTLFLASYAAVWSVGGFVLIAIAEVLDRLGPAVPVAAGAALLWQCTPVKQRCLNRHHAYPPLAAFGRPARRAAVRFGSRRAAWCVGSCWPLMLLPLVVVGDPLAVMAAATLWIWAEQLEFPAVASWRIRVPGRAVLILRASAGRLVHPALRPPARVSGQLRTEWLTTDSHSVPN